MAVKKRFNFGDRVYVSNVHNALDPMAGDVLSVLTVGKSTMIVVQGAFTVFCSEASQFSLERVGGFK